MADPWTGLPYQIVIESNSPCSFEMLALRRPPLPPIPDAIPAGDVPTYRRAVDRWEEHGPYVRGYVDPRSGEVTAHAEDLRRAVREDRWMRSYWEAMFAAAVARGGDEGAVAELARRADSLAPVGADAGRDPGSKDTP